MNTGNKLFNSLNLLQYAHLKSVNVLYTGNGLSVFLFFWCLFYVCVLYVYVCARERE